MGGEVPSGGSPTMGPVMLPQRAEAGWMGESYWEREGGRGGEVLFSRLVATHRRTCLEARPARWLAVSLWYAVADLHTRMHSGEMAEPWIQTERAPSDQSLPSTVGLGEGRLPARHGLLCGGRAAPGQHYCGAASSACTRGHAVGARVVEFVFEDPCCCSAGRGGSVSTP